MSNIISSLGAGSGIDTTSLVSSLVEAERAPKEALLDKRQTKLEAQISAYGTLKSALSTFSDLMAPLADNDTFNARSIAFPTTDLITPNSLDAGAQAGTYQITVEDVAQSHTLAMSPVADKNAALNASGILSFQFGAWTYDLSDNPSSFAVNDDRAAFDIEVTTTDTLATLAQKINDSDSGIQASVLNVDGQYQLMLTAPSGVNNALKITSDDLSLKDYEYNETNYTPTESQEASDAIITVNGLTVTRESNEIDDVIPGFNFTLNKKSPGEKLTFTVEADTATAKQAIRDFVEGYNELYTTIKNLTGISKDPETNETILGGLSTDGSAKTLFSQLRSLISKTVPGIDAGYNALTNIGIRTELDGTISIDDKDFDSAFANNYDLIESLFATNINSANPYVEATAGTYVAKATPGSFAFEVTTDPQKGYLNGSSITQAGFVDLDDSFSPAVTIADTENFKISVNGTESESITIDGTYSNVEELRAALQAKINGDVNLKAARAEVDVSFDPVNNWFTFTSRDYGASSKVSFTEVTAGLAGYGLDTALVGVAGVDVAGTIDGEAGFGSANILLPSLDSSLYGLNFTIRPGAAAVGASTLNFSRGFAGEMNRLIQQFLASDGVIASREDSINSQLTDVADDRDDLDRRMEKYETRISAQFLAMEQIIASLNSTGSSLDGIIDRLPFTASKK